MLKPWHLSQLDAAVDLFNQSAKKLQRGMHVTCNMGLNNSPFSVSVQAEHFEEKESTTVRCKCSLQVRVELDDV